jgi:RNA polymerase sigma factor (sigma-70 family)
LAEEKKDWIERLHLKYGSELRQFLQRKVGVRAVAEDLEQDTYVRLQRLSEADTSNPRALLFITASNLASTYLVRARAENSVIEHSSTEDEAVADTAVTPSRAAELDLAIRKMAEIVERMPARHREVWVMHVVQGLSLEQISQTLGITIDAVAKRFRRGTISLRQKLSRLGIDEVMRS